MSWFWLSVIFVAILVLVWRRASRFWLRKGYSSASSHGSAVVIGACLAGLVLSVITRVQNVLNMPDPSAWQVSAGVSQSLLQPAASIDVASAAHVGKITSPTAPIEVRNPVAEPSHQTSSSKADTVVESAATPTVKPSTETQPAVNGQNTGQPSTAATTATTSAVKPENDADVINVGSVAQIEPNTNPDNGNVDQTVPDKHVPVKAELNNTGASSAGQGTSDPDKAKPNKNGQATAEQSGSKPDQVALDAAGPNKAEPDTAGPETAGPEKAGPGKAGQDKPKLDKAKLFSAWCDYLINKDRMVSRVSDQFGYSPSEGMQAKDDIVLVYTTPYLQAGKRHKLRAGSIITIKQRRRNEVGEIVYDAVLPDKKIGVFASTTMSWFDTADHFAEFDQRRQQWLQQQNKQLADALLKTFPLTSIEQAEEQLGKQAKECFG